jgi:hypothetical protein
MYKIIIVTLKQYLIYKNVESICLYFVIQTTFYKNLYEKNKLRKCLIRE